MATTISTQDIIDAKRDIEDIGKAVNENVIVDPRYGADFKSLPMVAAEAQATIGEWQDAINTIVINDGVPALAVLDASGVTQQEINTDQLSFNAALAAVAMISESNTWQQNRDIIQAVNDALYLQKGGGKIQLPSGDFVLKGVLLDSHVKVQGNNTNIRHPDNYDVNIFETRTYSTTGSCVLDEFTVTVADGSKFQVGSLIAIQGAGGLSRTQSSMRS